MVVRNSKECLVCGEVIDKKELICEECKGIEALDLVRLICRIGVVVPEGYEVISLYKDRIVLAENENKNVPEPYVVWSVDFEGCVYGGNYFINRQSAEAYYFNRLLNMV